MRHTKLAITAVVLALLPMGMFAKACEEHRTSRPVPKRISQLLDGIDNKTLICNMTDLRKGVRITYTYENPLPNMIQEQSFSKDGTVTTHAAKARPVWGTETLYADRGDIFFIATYLKDPVYKLVINDRPQLSDEEPEEGFPTSKAKVIKEGYGPVSEGFCHVVIQ